MELAGEDGPRWKLPPSARHSFGLPPKSNLTVVTPSRTVMGLGSSRVKETKPVLPMGIPSVSVMVSTAPAGHGSASGAGRTSPCPCTHTRPPSYAGCPHRLHVLGRATSTGGGQDLTSH
jgi:hypothetical protein